MLRITVIDDRTSVLFDELVERDEMLAKINFDLDHNKKVLANYGETVALMQQEAMKENTDLLR